jgi:hypothetical protein
MIQIEDLNLGLAVANQVDWYIDKYRTNGGNPLTVIVHLQKDNIVIHNWDGNPIGIKLIMPEELRADWGSDDTIVEDWILETIGAVRLTP